MLQHVIQLCLHMQGYILWHKRNIWQTHTSADLTLNKNIAENQDKTCTLKMQIGIR